MTYDYWEENRHRVSSQYEAWRRKKPKCSCNHTHKVVVAIYKGDIEILGISDPKHIEVTILNLDENHYD